MSNLPKNPNRFSFYFMFLHIFDEWKLMLSQIVMSNSVKMAYALKQTNLQ